VYIFITKTSEGGIIYNDSSLNIDWLLHIDELKWSENKHLELLVLEIALLYEK